jgi:hypothetical protein
MSNVVDFAMRMKDMLSGPLRNMAGAFDKVSDEATNAANKVSLFEKMSMGAFGINNIIGSVQTAINAVQQFTEANQVQQEAEAKLAQVMRNTMSASDAEIQSIKDLTAAQQQLGIVGDEVQLAGSQELGTYLEQTESLKKLIPVMNDMIAQQYGYSATQESAVNIATMMGKVMEGQVGALSRYGYKFDEAQEKILKFGTEAEKVATLAEVIGESVGGMNEALAQTPEGRMKQLGNTLGDVKEQIGSSIIMLASSFMPVLQGAVNMIAMFASGLQSIAGWMQQNMPIVVGFASAIGILTVAINGATIAARAAQIATAAWSAAQAVLNAIMTANPIGLIIAACAALIGIVVQVIRKWDEWGAAFSLILGPLGLLISMVQSFRRNWDSVVKAFKADGILGGLKRIGQVMLDAVLAPIQQLLELLSNIPGLGHLAGKGAQKIASLRASMNTLPTQVAEGETTDPEDQTTHNILEEIATNTATNNAAGTATSEAVTSSGPKQITINVQKFFDSIQFSTTNLNESTAQIEEAVLECLSRVLVQGATTA